VSLQSLRAHHLAPSVEPSANEQFFDAEEFHDASSQAPPPTITRQITPTQYYNLTPPRSPRQDVNPEVQRHYDSVPDAPTRSKTKKMIKTFRVRKNKFLGITDTTIDDTMQRQHDMDVDDAEMQQAQIESKQEHLLQRHKMKWMS
jgi:hypothetical protein